MRNMGRFAVAYHRKIFLHFLAGLTLALLSATQSLACSCGTNWTFFSEMVDSYDVIFKGTVLFIDDRIPMEVQGNRYARFAVEKVYKGDEVEEISVYYVFEPGSCVHNHYVTGETYTIFADKRRDGTIAKIEMCGETTIVYDEAQTSSYFNMGVDSPLLSSLCAQHIKLAYDAQVFLGEFRLIDKTCESAIPLYNSLYRKQSK